VTLAKRCRAAGPAVIVTHSGLLLWKSEERLTKLVKSPPSLVWQKSQPLGRSDGCVLRSEALP
jgi:hypothetical protein